MSDDDPDLIVDSIGWTDDGVRDAARAELAEMRARLAAAEEVVEAILSESRHRATRGNECDICEALADYADASKLRAARGTTDAV